MSSDKQAIKKLTPQDEAILVEAMEQYFSNGVSEVACNQCHKPIQFRQLSETSWEHSCECGKFNGTMQGL